MNKIYKLKYDRRRNQVVAVSELTAGAGKESTGQVAALAGLTDMCSFRKILGTLTPLAFLTGLVMSLLPGIALANPDLPTGGQIVAGQGSISTNGNQMTISQNTHGLVTNWNTFDVGQNHTVQFVQPDSSAVALNRVTGGHESQILGTLTANGQVMLVNPAGVMFGKGATVNTAGLVASTKNISNADFMAGHYTFSGGSDAGAEVVNQGNLTTTKGGFIVLAADRVKNSGTIITPGGKTVLAAGDKVTLQLDNTGLASVSVSGSVVNALVENSGLLSATDGRVYLTARGKDMLLNTVVNNTGTVEASGLSGHGGEIVLNGGDSGVVNQSGQLLADSHAGPGGKITVEGQNIHLAANSRTSATGKTGGGEVYVGGGWQGKDSRIGNASKVVMDRSATVDVSATDAGRGGTAVLWSDDYTNFRGTILAKGGALAGDGGRVETSSHKNLQAFGDVDTSASAGHGGNWLLDPLDVTIVSGDTNTSVTESGKGSGATLDTDTDHIFSPSASGARVSAQKIADQLNAGTDVTVDTHADGQEQGNITFAKDASIKKNTDGNATLTLKADKDITFVDRKWSRRNDTDTGAIVSTAGKLNLNLLTGNSGQNGKTTFGSYARLYLNGGDVFIGPANASAGSASVFFKNDGMINAGDITLNTRGGVTGNYYTLNAIKDLTVKGPLSVNAGYNITSGIKAGGLLSIIADLGDISFSAQDTSGESAGGKILIEGKNGINIQANNGHLVMNVVDKNQNTINVSSDNGYVALGGKIQDGTNGLSLTNVGITSKDKTTIDGTTFWGKAALLSGLNVTANGDIDIRGVARRLSDDTPGRASSSGVQISGSSITSTTGNITVTGSAATDKSHPGISTLDISNSNITADSKTGKIVLNGTTETTTGVKVTSSNLTAASLEVKGVATKQGTGFSLIKSHLLNGLADLNNVTFSSAGSAADVTNSLDSSIVTEDNRATLLAWHPENMTIIDMDRKPIFDDTVSATKGWTADYSYDDTPYGGWIFNNTSVTTGGTVNLKSAGFTNSTITISVGDFRLNNAGPVILNGDTITVSNGGMDVHSLAGSVYVNATNITAKSNINLTADDGQVTIVGTSNESLSGIISEERNINIAAVNKKGYAIKLENVKLSSSKGNIDAQGTGSNVLDQYNQVGALMLSGTIDSSAQETKFTGTNTAKSSGSNASIGVLFGGENKETTWNARGGKVNISGVSDDGAGVTFGFSSNGKTKNVFNIYSSEMNLEGRTSADTVPGVVGTGGIIFSGYGYKPSSVDFNLFDNASFTMTGDASKAANKVQGITNKTIKDSAPGASIIQFIFSGVGNVSIISKSNDGDGLRVNAFDNTKLTGDMSIYGESNTGIGVAYGPYLNLSISGATITGKSTSGTGVFLSSSLLNNKELKVSLNDNVIEGTSDTGSGISIKGDNITLTNGSLHGTSKGSAAGVSLQGNSNYTISGATVKGESVDGAGVSAGGNLIVNNGAVLQGTATGSGSGVVISGDLTNTDGDNTKVAGTAASGDGVQIAGNSSLVNTTLTGKSTSGAGVNVSGNLTLSGKSTIKGTSDTETGVILGASLSGGDVTGVSTSGTGLKLADNASVTSSVLEGASTSGSGIAVTGKTVLDDTTAQKLHAESERGNGLSLEEGADISVVQTGPQTQVTTPVVLTGTSQTGSGVATSGNVSISGVTLKGKTSVDGGTGVTLGGNLTVADAISGINASATGNGTALKISDGVVDAKGYRDAGKTLVIRATSEEGAAVSTSGSSSLISVELGGTASGNGSAVVVSGSLSTDNALTAESKGDKGTALQLSGGHLRSTAANEAPVKVTVSATGNGTAVAVTQPEDGGTGSGLSGIDLAASADRGSVMDIAADLTTDRDISVSTENGVAVSLNGGSLQGAEGEHPVTVTAQATGSGTAVTVKPSSEGKENSLANLTLNTTSAQGDALNVEGVLNTKDVMVVANSTGTGTALNVSGGEIHSQDGTGITATSDSGHAAVINNGKLTGDSSGALTITATTTSDSPALDIGGTSDISNSVVSGKNSGNGSAVSVAGVVTSSGGGEIKGQTVNGTAVEIKDGTSATSSQEGGLLITATASGEKGTGVVLSNATLTGSRINADATQGNAVTITDGRITGGSIAGHALGGTGLNISNAVLSKVVASGTTQTGTGSAINGTLTSDNVSQITGSATQDGGNGVNVSGSVTGGQVEGHATSGDAVTVADGSSVADAEVKGDAESGTGVNVAGKAMLTNASLSGTTQTGKGAIIAGSVTADAKSVVSGTATQDGGNGVNVSGSVTGGQVEGHAISGDAVNITGAVSHSEILGDATTGTGVVVNSGSKVEDTAVSGSATAGTGTHWHAGVEHNNVTMIGNATTGTGVKLDADGSLKNATVNGSTESGKGVNIAGALTSTGGTTIAGHSSGSGTGVDVGGDIIGGSITGNATGTGTGVKVSGQDVNVSDAVVKGSTDSGTGMSVTGNLTGNDFATVTGQATGNGTGVDVSGKLNGTVSGSSSSGIGIRAGDGADIAQGSHVDGHSDSGTGAVIQGSVTNQGSITGQSGSGVGALIGGTVSGKGDITGISKGAGEGVTLEGNVTGGSITGQTDGGTGLSISDNSTLSDVDVSGNTVTGTGVHVKGNLASNSTTTVAGTASGTGTGTLLSGDVTGGVVNGHSADGVGVATDRDVTLTDVAVSGTSVSHSGVQINSHVSNAGSASITGSSESGAGVSLNGTVSGGVLKGHSLGGPGLHVTGESHVNGVDVGSSSEQGPAVQMDGTLSTSDSSLNGQQLQDTAVVDVVRQAAYQQQGVIANTDRMNHPVMASGYRGLDKPVSVEICTDGQCSRLEAGTLATPARQQSGFFEH